jgi:hypothetical protein
VILLIGKISLVGAQTPNFSRGEAVATKKRIFLILRDFLLLPHFDLQKNRFVKKLSSMKIST